jgi:hypothetical protein
MAGSARSRFGAAVALVVAIVGVAVVPAVAAPANRTEHPIWRATRSYLASTCAIDLSGIPDGTLIDRVSGCGEVVTFSVPLRKMSVPATWPKWGSPPKTEGTTPNVLGNGAASSVTLTFSRTRREVGFETEPRFPEIHYIEARFSDSSGNEVGDLASNIRGEGGAHVIGELEPIGVKVKTITISTDTAFAIAQIRVGH